MDFWEFSDYKKTKHDIILITFTYLIDKKGKLLSLIKYVNAIRIILCLVCLIGETPKIYWQ